MNNYFLQLKKDIPNDIGWIRRILSYAFDWYNGGMIASLPVIVIYMMLHQDATYIPQNLSIFHAPYNIIAGSLSFIVASGYYVLVPMFVFKGQTLGKKIFHLKIIANNYDEVTNKQLFIRQFIMILLVEGSVFTSSNMLHQLLQVVTGLNIPKYYAYFGIFMTLISVILMIVLKSRRPLHDLFADTREVYLESNDYTYYQKKRKKVKRKSGK